MSANCIIFVINKPAYFENCTINILSPHSDLSLLTEEKFDDTYHVKITLWEQSKDLQYQIFQKDEIATLINRIQSTNAHLAEHLDVMQGIVPYSRETHSEEIVK